MLPPDPIPSETKRVSITRLRDGWMVVFDGEYGSRAVAVSGSFDTALDYVRNELSPKPFFDGSR